jgi:uncharacterized surface protein with fasciclin (FAS1) repeats
MQSKFARFALPGAVAAVAAAAALIAPVAFAKECPQQMRASLTSAAMTSPAASRGDIVDVASGAGQFSTLLAAAQAAGLVGALQGDGPLTVFAPTDDAFRALPAGTVERLLRPENRAELRRILSYHVVEGAVFASDLSGRTSRPRTLAGARVSVDGRQGVSVNNARVVTADVRADNGVIHVIDRVLLPPAH